MSSQVVINKHVCRNCAEDCDCGSKDTESCITCSRCLLDHDEPVEEDKRVKGQIVALKPNGYGFIVSPDIPFERIYFHWTALKQSTLRFPALEKGMKVEFQAQNRGDRGYRAVYIEVVK